MMPSRHPRVPEHRVRLPPQLRRLQQLLFDGGESTGRLLDEQLFVVREELVQWRVEETHRDGETVHRLEDADEVGLLLRPQLFQRAVFVVGRVGEDHALHDRKPVAEEHVLGAAETDAFGAELARLGRVLGKIRVRADLHRAELVGPTEDDPEGTRRLGRDHRDRAQHDLAGVAVDRDDVALVHDDAACLELLRLHVDLHGLGAADRGRAHPARDHRRVRHQAAARRQDALGRDHAVQVVGRRLGSHEDHTFAGGGVRFRVVRGEVDLAHRRARRRVQALGEHVELRRGVELRVQHLVELCGLHAQHRFALVDDALVLHLDGHPERSHGGSLADARLQQEQATLLDRELDVAHVAVVLLELFHHLEELLGAARGSPCPCRRAVR